jgi:hypothetical protein
VSPKMFSLFNVHRWGTGPGRVFPAQVGVVPTLYHGYFSEAAIQSCVQNLRAMGSVADPQCKNPEGIVIYHTAAKTLFKVTLEKDESPKGPQEEA